jgi:hypothetical protein
VDTHIRLPNKVLITTRFRDFAGDYSIEVRGMTDEEALRLINQEAGQLGIRNLLRPNYKDELVDESDGHPYVIKILLGQVATQGRAVKPERIVAGADQVRIRGKLSTCSIRSCPVVHSLRISGMGGHHHRNSSLLMARSGGIFEATRYARPCEISRTTVSNYLKAMEATFVVCLCRPFSSHRSTVIVSAPKVYLRRSTWSACRLWCGS